MEKHTISLKDTDGNDIAEFEVDQWVIEVIRVEAASRGMTPEDVILEVITKSIGREIIEEEQRRLDGLDGVR